MKTAMQELYTDLEKFKGITDTVSITDIQRMIGHYVNEKEKQDIIDSFNQGMNSVEYFLPNNKITEAEQYYKETYIDSNQAGI
jgi:hypothetical protein